ncbi:AAA family ATPase [Bdellovibrionota bacterium FG-2]
MPHQKARNLLDLLEKRLKMLPVVGVLGARQTGKSTLLRNLLATRRRVAYVTLDREEVRVQAQRQPTLFLSNLESSQVQTVCIDEIQKAPVLFDTLKAEVDERKRPGRFAVSGSTEFSKKTGIMESLTGRIALLRLFPLCLAEIIDEEPSYFLTDPLRPPNVKTKPHLKDVATWIARGGMPGLFAVRDTENREALYETWIETTCTRDLAQFKIPRFNPDLARRIFLETAKADVPNRTEIASAVGRDPRQIEAYLQAFKALFVFYEIEPYKTSAGKSLFYLFDSGIAGFAGADSDRRLQGLFLNECFSQFSYSAQMRPDVFYYQSSRGSRIDFIVQARKLSYAIKLVENEAPSTYQLRSVDAFLAKNREIPVLVAAPCLNGMVLDKGVSLVSWASLG